MPGLRTYSDGKNIYSVDMMLAYIDTYKPPVVELELEELIPQLEQKVWGNWSPLTVLDKMDAKKYTSNAQRIRDADLSYPIIVTGSPTSRTRRHAIVDGYHRTAKAHMRDMTKIRAHIFDAELMKKFILDRTMDFVKVHQDTGVNEILTLWTKRFCTV
jgi:hypothetical protein